MLSDLIKRVFEIEGKAYIVGGYIRKLQKGQESSDIDIVAENDVERLANILAEDIKGTVVAFKKGGIIRVVSDNITLDFSRIQGSIHDDLGKRDFTINAIAWSPSEGLIDPFDGIGDIKKGIIRAISEKNLRDDPLRLLRAYRFVAEEGYKIDSETRGMIRRLRRELSSTAAERITSELFKILLSPGCVKALGEAFDDGLLREIIDIDRGQLNENIKAISKIDRFIDRLKESEGFKMAVDQEFSQGLTYRGLLRLERLLMGSDLNKNRLILSRAIWKRLKTVTGAFIVYMKEREKISRKALFDIFYELRDASIDFSILTGSRKIFAEARRFLDMKDIMPGNRIAEITGLKGKKIGDLLKKLRYLQFIGRLDDRETLITKAKDIADSLT